MNSVEKVLTTNSSNKEKKTNKKKIAILNAIFQKGKISINDLMKKLNISFPTLNAFLVDLVVQGLIIQHERGESIGGRKPNLYQLNDNLFKIVTVEVRKQSLKIQILDNNCVELVPSKTYSYQLSKDKSQLKALINTVRNYVIEAPIHWDEISGIAISMPGLIEKSKGINYSYFYEDDFQLEKQLENEFYKPTIIINDAKTSGIAEQYYGALKGKKDGVMVHLDWGIALTFISNHSLHWGKNGFAGEIGHISFKEEGELCYCGKRGCLETLISGASLVEKAKQDIEAGIPTVLNMVNLEEEIQPKHLIQAALNGDQYAIQLMTTLGNKLGKALAMILQLFNPEIVVISGEFAKASPLLSSSIQQQFHTYTMKMIANNCELVASNLGDRSNSMGLVRYFVKRYFEENLG
ncbi:ROK family transcriptional regulator [Sphingobacterium kyonggiense]|uniref:ROK family transcriptional regulator n=1 Tax=Sphingobacterium kyonggiense TaxID=714075 RepID=A0ABP7Z6H0_9SPHI